MQNYSWKTELLKTCFPLAVVALLSVLFDLGVWPLFIAALISCGWLLRQLQKLSDWLQTNIDSEPPEAIGMWGQVLDNIYDLHKQTRQDNARLQAMIDYLRSSFASMSDAVVMLDGGGNIEWCNLAALDLLGLRKEDTGRQLVNLLRAPAFLHYFDANDYSAPLEIYSPVNAHIQLSISISYFGQGNRLLFGRDVTRTHRLEKMRKDFIANVSHELRTPLTVINGYLETFVEHGGENPRWDRAIKQMLLQSKRMHSLIQHLMLLSRLETLPAAAEQEVVKLRPFMDMLAEELAAAAKGERIVNIECDDSVQLKGSYAELRSAFSNLAINAARYTEDGDHISLRWYQDNQYGYFEVEDSGIGIEPQYIPRLTERFYRIEESRSIDTGGTGLGLAIVKHVLIRHRAELRIHSVISVGSRFSCVFPKSSLVEAGPAEN